METSIVTKGLFTKIAITMNKEGEAYLLKCKIKLKKPKKTP